MHWQSSACERQEEGGWRMEDTDWRDFCFQCGAAFPLLGDLRACFFVKKTEGESEHTDAPKGKMLVF